MGMNKLFCSFCIYVASINLVSSESSSSGPNFASLPVELQASCLQDTSVKDKIELLKSVSRSLLLHCIEIKKQVSLFPEDLKTISDIPDLASRRVMSASLRDIGSNLDIIESHTYTGAWKEEKVDIFDIRKLEKLKSVIVKALEEVDVTLDKVGSLLVKCKDVGIELGVNVSLGEIDGLRSIIFRLKSLDALFPYSYVDLSRAELDWRRKEEWDAVIQSLPVTVKNIKLTVSKIDASGLRELSRLTKLEEIDLHGVKLSNPADWASVIQSLPVTVKQLILAASNIDTSGLRELSRLSSLEEINLFRAELSNPADWASVIQSLPVTVKQLYLGDVNIDASGLRELSRLSSVEEMDLSLANLTNRDNWASVIQSLPVTVKILGLDASNIDASGLRELSRLSSLEDIRLYCVYLSNQDNWASVIQSLPLTVKEISLWDSNIDVSGLRELSRLTSLEEIDLSSVKLTNPGDWTMVIKSLPSTVRIIDFEHSNCPDDVKAQLRSKGIVVK